MRRGLQFFAILVLFCCGTVYRATAQEDRPQIFPGERKAPRKKDAGPRALAVLQMAANGKVSVVPVAILVNGKFYDATAYKADPVPMALDSGTIYEGERTGSSLGLFTVGGALHSNAVNVQDPWIGTGQWQPKGSEPATKGIKAESTPVGIDKSDEPPRLTKNPNAANETKPAAPASTPTPAAAPSSSPSSGDEPPRLTTPPTSGKPSDSSQPQSSGGASGTNGSASPTASTDSKAGESKTADAKPSDSKSAPDSKAPDSKTADSKNDKNTDVKADTKSEVKAPASDSGASEANRPRLRRGKPAESFADEEIPGYSKFGAKPKNPSEKTTVTAAAGPIDLVPAVSDASGPEPRSYSFEWLKGEEEDRRKQMMDLAKQQLHTYLAGQAKSKTTAAPAAAKSKAVSKKLPEPIFGAVRMVAYDLWGSNQPVIIFTADAHMPPAPAGVGQSAYDAEMQYSIVLVAYPDTYQNLRKIYGTVTDKFHLDLTPRLQLIDAVDADGDGRGELLFRETSDAGMGWVVYRASADKLWKLFDSLNPE